MSGRAQRLRPFDRGVLYSVRWRARWVVKHVAVFGEVSGGALHVIGVISHVGDAGEAARRVGVAAVVMRDLRIDAERPLEKDRLRRIVVGVFGGNDLVWRRARLDPLIERGEQVVRRVDRSAGARCDVSEKVCARPAGAMLVPAHAAPATGGRPFAPRVAMEVKLPWLRLPDDNGTIPMAETVYRMIKKVDLRAA
jgi:hypothetical protein